MKKKDIEKSIRDFLSSFDENSITEFQKNTLLENINIFKKELEFQNDELRRINSELEQKNLFIENLFDFVPSPLILIQNDFKILKSNKVCNEIFGNHSNVKSDFRKIFKPQSQEDLYALLTQRANRVILHAIDDKIYLVESSQVVFSEDTFTLLHLSDITALESSKEKLQKENEIRNLFSELANMHIEKKIDFSHFDIIEQKLIFRLLSILKAERVFLGIHDQGDNSAEDFRLYKAVSTENSHPIDDDLLQEVESCIKTKKNIEQDPNCIQNLSDTFLRHGRYLYTQEIYEHNLFHGLLIILTTHKVDTELIQFIQVEISKLFYKLKVETKIFESEKRLNAIVSNIPEGIAVIENNQIIYASDNYFKITNVPREDSRWQNLSEIFNYLHPDDRVSVQEKLLSAIHDRKERVSYEFRILDAKGDYVWQQDTVSIVYRDDGTFRLYVIARNYNEYKKQLQYLKTLEAAINQSNASIVITDSNGFIQYVNKAFTDITGYTPEEVLQKNPRILKSGKVSDDTYKDLWNTITSGRSWIGELINKKKDGTLYIESATISPVILDDKITNFVAVKSDVTKFKELNNQYETLSLVASHTQNIVIITDNQGYIKWVNQSFEKKTGYTFDEVVGKKPGSFLQGKDTNSAHVFIIRKKLRELVPFKQEILNYTKSGQPYWIEMNITPIFDEKGNHIMYIAVEDDITIRKDFERKILESERKNRAILSALPDLLFVIDRDYRYIDFHAYDLSQILIEPEKFIGKTIMEVMPPEQGKLIVENIKDTFRTAELREFHFHLDIGKKRKYYEGRCVLKDLQTVLILIRDISKTKLYEQELQNEKLLFKTVIDNLPNTIYVKDKSFKKILVNKAEVFYPGKTSEEEVLGRSDQEFYSEEVYQGIQQEDTEVINGKPLINKIIEYTNNRGDQKFMMISKLPFRDSNGQIAGIIGIGIDITELKYKEQELQKTIQIITDQNQRLRNFTYIVSHNIRAYSANIDGLIDLLNSSIVSEEEKPELLKLLQKASENLMETISTLNEIITIENKINDRVEKVEIHKILEKVLEVVRKDIHQYKISVVNEIPPGKIVMHNPAYLESILLNLTTNAIKYRNKDIQSIIKYTYKELSDKKILEVSDNGLGINLEKYGKKIFSMFETFHGNPDAKGLGLFITKAQVEALGGKIEVESKVNEGSTFRIIFKS